MTDIWACVEYRGEKICRWSQEALSEAVHQAGKLGARCTAVVLGYRVPSEVLESIRLFGVDRVLVCDEELLSEYSTLRYTRCLERIIKEHIPDLLLMGSSAVTRDLAPRLSARLRCGFISEATFLQPQGDRLYVTRAAFRSHASVILSFRNTGFAIIALAPKIMEVEQGVVKPRCVLETPAPLRALLSLDCNPITIERVVQELPSRMELTDAEVIVAGGKGMQTGENFRLLEELAGLLGGTVAATRVAVDLKWRPRECLVGVSGHVVSPGLYIACGISGAIQHLMGMQSSETIIAINTDLHAPIFRIATLGILGDVRDVLPVVIETFRKKLAEKQQHSSVPHDFGQAEGHGCCAER